MDLSGLFLFLVVSISISFSFQASLDEELTLTYDQKMKLDKLRDLVSNRVPHPYMKEDLQLVRWLRVTDFNIPAAERMILENIKWREENRIDDILNEDWSDMDKEYKIYLEGCDRDGRPVISVTMGDWDMRKAALSGQAKRMMRYMDKLMEEGSVLVRRMQKAGYNVTQFVELVDLGNFNLKTHACPQCLPIYAYNFQSYEKHYPLSIHRAVTVNTPAYFNTVFQILRPLLSKQTRDIISIYGQDKAEWQSKLRNLIAPENLSKPYGGFKEEAWDTDELRRNPKLYECKKPGSDSISKA